jgi:hypothetical protein
MKKPLQAEGIANAKTLGQEGVQHAKEACRAGEKTGVTTITDKVRDIMKWGLEAC